MSYTSLIQASPEVFSRYLRFHRMGNTTNHHGHLVEVRAFNTTEAAK